VVTAGVGTLGSDVVTLGSDVVFGTLGSDVVFGTLGSDGVSGVGDGSGVVSLFVCNGENPGGGRTGSAAVRNMSASCTSAPCCVSVSGDKAEAGDGFCSACTMSAAAATIASFDVAVGILTADGNHASVSAMRSEEVSVAYTR